MLLRFCLFATLIFTASGGQPITCDTCPVPGVDPKASTPFAQADTSQGCKARMRAGLPIPDPRCTPGAINPSITLEVLQNSAFRTACVRDCATGESAKNAVFKLYAIPRPSDNKGDTQTCELDHLVSLELGGADTLDNIWPQCGPDQVTLTERYFKRKDLVENFLGARVKSGKLILADVQKGLATDWTQYLPAAQTFCANNPITCGVAH